MIEAETGLDSRNRIGLPQTREPCKPRGWSGASYERRRFERKLFRCNGADELVFEFIELEPSTDVQVNDFSSLLDSYIEGLQTPKIKSLAELIAFNEEHRDLELPSGLISQYPKP